MNRLRTLMAALGDAYLVGGAVRDAILGINADIKDYDIEVFGVDYDTLIAMLSNIYGDNIKTVGKAFGVVKVRDPELGEVDISLPRKESKIGVGDKGFEVTPDGSMTIAEAAKRRDFTINAIYYNYEKGFIDPYDGIRDLRDGVLREVNYQTFAEAPLRVLRGMQFAARFNLVPARSLVSLCYHLFPEYKYTSIGQVWCEWEKWAVKGTVPSLGLKLLDDTLWIEHFPELLAMNNCLQEPMYHPEGNVFRHTMHVCDAAARIASRENMDDKSRTILMFAALCHDMGKPTTTFVSNDGRIVSPNHAQELKPTYTFLESIGAPKWVIQNVVPLVENHMAHLNEDIGKSGVRRLANRVLPSNIKMLGWLVEADHSGRPPLETGMPANMQRIMNMAQSMSVAEDTVTCVISGYDLIQLGMVQGKKLGAMLGEIYELQLDGAIENREQAIEYAKTKLD